MAREADLDPRLLLETQLHYVETFLCFWVSYDHHLLHIQDNANLLELHEEDIPLSTSFLLILCDCTPNKRDEQLLICVNR